MTGGYQNTLRAYDTSTFVNAESPGKAKYQHFLSLDGLFESFDMYLRFVESCILVNNVPAEKLKNEDFQRIIEQRQIPHAKIGMRVELNGERGYIVGSNNSCNLDVAFDNGVYNCHPHHELIYFTDDGRKIYDFRREVKERS